MGDAFILDAVRTPRGKGKRGALHSVKPVELAATALRGLAECVELDTGLVDDVVWGCVTPVGEQGADIARAAVLHAGWDVDVPGVQVNRFCASGLEAVNLAAAKVASGWEDLVVAGGSESMSRVPMGSDGGAWYGDPELNLATGFVPQGVSADLIATMEGFGRAELDAYAARSHQRAAAARAAGRFDRSLVPVVDRLGAVLLKEDEAIRPETTVESLAGLAPSFAGVGAAGFDAVAVDRYPMVERIEHRHTAGNSSAIVDGAAALLVGSAAAAERIGARPRARVLATAVVGTEPTIMLTGPAPAARRALARAGMGFGDIDLFEVNEAFAAVVLKFLRDTGVDEDRVNVNGGAIALGHPLGATGCVLVGTLLDELERRDLTTGLATLCVGAGMGVATVVERV
ncbi:acetyl-CoA C-acetyltransferase [Streptoalloteichus tenebrarius]|uniref:Acetyl-CoA C-acetyltransferase n=1 Tax=Streptoalloteichus tenebrarius (strain ATCC 17920 / DSM 40477 / JCM 4838 / CBS 697.72 / NBRC 16177 / NCIMB 11028 / NRRL B-12390 / A12253. 1 / ISP 5477) TaxID=1933 RepID=A0ABT1HZ04_STRSD|nr:acetyl-CoA C-acetyltransferase [Streptoalloteichus tenebrarius]MCP2260743.1 acetyl-CoA C-acetyltransferase [Streptoalloteichus tenebrarius]BFF03446.1 acetyl-CoA C-acetyltransferase [Streptoalloteichus tenebrarius]